MCIMHIAEYIGWTWSRNLAKLLINTLSSQLRQDMVIYCRSA